MLKVGCACDVATILLSYNTFKNVHVYLNRRGVRDTFDDSVHGEKKQKERKKKWYALHCTKLIGEFYFAKLETALLLVESKLQHGQRLVFQTRRVWVVSLLVSS